MQNSINVKEVDVVILTPGHSVTTSYLKCLLNTIIEFDRLGIRWAYSSEYSSHVGDAREITLSSSEANDINNSVPFHGKIKYKKLMWIDSDITWEPEDILRLFYSDKEIIAGVYLFADGRTSVFKEFLGSIYTKDEILKLDNITEIQGSGFGFICIQNGIFELMSRPWFQSSVGTIERNGEKISFPVMGEDLSFCLRAQKLGYKIWLDPKVKVGHQKTIKLEWN